jgi:hypothetical protein
MNLVALAVITVGSALSTLVGLISSYFKGRRNKSADAVKKGQYTLTILENGREVEYRIESDSRQEAEAEIKNIIENA